MARHYRSQVSFIPQWDITNPSTATHSWVDLTDNVDPLDAATEIRGRLDQAYSVLDTYSGQAYDDTALKVYDWDEPEPRVPILSIDTGALSSWAPMDGTLPQEVAAVVSFRGAYASGMNRQSVRGRTYLGPLGYGAINLGGLSGPAELKPTFLAACGQWADGMFDPIMEPITWSVWSPTLNVWTSVEYWGANNEPDTMRSRERRAGTLINWQPLS